ncbi:helix-turn-helix domain-containing protein [Streptomyces sp. NPDC001127]|uniref:helix-turn-helix domain-containing protein n=1 Tax=Streptomyces sp. NPDC001127 TaxID=3154377 RepID=UPI0033250976
MLLPEMLWPRRMDAAEVIGAGLEIAALGMGHRQIAARLGLADGTVRGWIRRFRRRLEDVRRYFTVALVALADDPVMPEPAASPIADAVSVIAAAHRAATMKWPQMHMVSRWEFAGRAITGRVLTCSLPAS